MWPIIILNFLEKQIKQLNYQVAADLWTNNNICCVTRMTCTREKNAPSIIAYCLAVENVSKPRAQLVKLFKVNKEIIL